jgi:adenylate cyclase
MNAVARLLYSLGFMSRERRREFFIGLACVFSLFTLVYFSSSLLGDPDDQSLDYDAGSLDVAMDWRLSSPAADSRILIVDIDERSLALMAEDYGRWPWPRSVIAEFIALAADLEPAAIGVNIMYSDSDLNDPDGDLLLEDIISYVPSTILPMTRLSPSNDELSEITVSMLPGVRIDEEGAHGQTVAMLFPMYASAQQHAGLNNLVVDDDGLVRRFQPYWLDDGFALPSMAHQMAQAAGDLTWSADRNRAEYLINWRNKGSDYARVSFVDLYNALMGEGSFDVESLGGKYLIVGLTAPGLAVLKGTSLSPITDDNLIIATSLDDVLNDSGIITMPSWVIVLLSIGMFFGLALLYIRDVNPSKIDLGFVIFETLGVGITLLSISYTRYAFDLSYVVLAGLAFYSLAAVYDWPAKGSMRATRRFFAEAQWSRTKNVCAVAFYNQDTLFNQTSRDFQVMLGARNVYPIDNLFSGASIATELLSSVRLLLVLNPEQAPDALSALDRRAGVTVNSLEYDTEHWKLRYQLSEVSLRAALSLLEEVRELRNVEMSDTEDEGAPYELR